MSEDSVKSLSDMPNDILRKIVHVLSDSISTSSVTNSQNSCKALICLSATSRWFSSIIDESVWQSGWELFSKNNKIPRTIKDRSTELSFRELLVLSANTGCQFCKKPQYRKIYTSFRVRCCKPCLTKRTINDYILKKNDVDLSLLIDLPYIVSCFSKFYWLETVDLHSTK